MAKGADDEAVSEQNDSGWPLYFYWCRAAGDAIAPLAFRLMEERISTTQRVRDAGLA